MTESQIQLSKKRGDRVKQLLKDGGMRQSELADLIGFTPEHLSAILNGRRTLTRETAIAIAKQFPPARFEWILCEDDYKTEQHRKMAPVISHLLEQRQREKAISSLLEIFSLSITFNVDGMADDVIAPGIDALTEETIDAVLPEFIDRLKSNRGYKLTRTTTGETLGYFSDQKREQFISEICDYVEFKLNKLIGEI